MWKKPAQMLKNFGKEVPLDDIFAFYEHLGLAKKLANKPQSGRELLAAAYAVFSDGEIDLPLGGRPLDKSITSIFGPQVPTQGSFYRALQAERHKVEYEHVPLSPAFEILQLHWAAHLASMLASAPEALDRLGWYWRIQNRALAFAPVRDQRGEFTLSESVSLMPLHQVIEIDSGIRGAFAVQRLYDGQLASPLQAHPFRYWTINRNDFYAQFLHIYLDAYGQYLFDYWKRNKDNGANALLYMTTNLPSYVAYGESLGNNKDYGRIIRKHGDFANLKGNPVNEINKIVADHKQRNANYELIDLVVWTSHSISQVIEQEFIDTITIARTVLRSGGGLLVGVPVLHHPEEANPILRRVETLARDIFGEKNTRSYLSDDTNKPESLAIGYVFMRK